jgi:hypothetical protein
VRDIATVSECEKGNVRRRGRSDFTEGGIAGTTMRTAIIVKKGGVTVSEDGAARSERTKKLAMKEIGF